MLRLQNLTLLCRVRGSISKDTLDRRRPRLWCARTTRTNGKLSRNCSQKETLSLALNDPSHDEATPSFVLTLPTHVTWACDYYLPLLHFDPGDGWSSELIYEPHPLWMGREWFLFIASFYSSSSPSYFWTWSSCGAQTSVHNDVLPSLLPEYWD